MFRYLFCLLLLLLPQSVFANVSVAILDFEGVGTAKKIPSSLTDLIMKGILKNKEPTIVIKMTEDKIQKIRKEK